MTGQVCAEGRDGGAGATCAFDLSTTSWASGRLIGTLSETAWWVGGCPGGAPKAPVHVDGHQTPDPIITQTSRREERWPGIWGPGAGSALVSEG